MPRKEYSKADINAIIDSIFHPLMKRHKFFVFVDGVLHALNEQNPRKSLEKFIRYNLKYLLE